MSSFLTIWENIQKSRSEKKGIKSIIHIGYNISEEFWSNFISILQHCDSMSKLLDVPEHKIVTWKDKIETAIDQEKESNSLVTGKNSKIVKEENESSSMDEKMRKIMETPSQDHGLITFFENKLQQIIDQNQNKLGSYGSQKINSLRDIPEERRNVIIKSIMQASMNIFFSGMDSVDSMPEKSEEKFTKQTPRTLPKDIF